METFLNKKAQAGKLIPLIVILLTVGIVIGIGFVVLDEFKQQLGTTSTTVTNETMIPTTAGVYAAYNHTNTNCFSAFTVTGYCNASDESKIGAGNFSYDPNTGRVWNITSDYLVVGEDMNINYTYLSSADVSCTGVEETIDAAQEIPQWLSIIVILGIIGIIFYIVFRVLPGRAGRSSGTIAEI